MPLQAADVFVLEPKMVQTMQRRRHHHFRCRRGRRRCRLGALHAVHLLDHHEDHEGQDDEVDRDRQEAAVGEDVADLQGAAVPPREAGTDIMRPVADGVPGAPRHRGRARGPGVHSLPRRQQERQAAHQAAEGCQGLLLPCWSGDRALTASVPRFHVARRSGSHWRSLYPQTQRHHSCPRSRGAVSPAK